MILLNTKDNRQRDNYKRNNHAFSLLRF